MLATIADTKLPCPLDKVNSQYRVAAHIGRTRWPWRVLPAEFGGWKRRGWAIKQYWFERDRDQIVHERLRGFRECIAMARRFEISRALLTRWHRAFRSGHIVAGERPKFVALSLASATAPSASATALRLRWPRGAGRALARQLIRLSQVLVWA
jgi:transposase-like protein